MKALTVVFVTIALFTEQARGEDLHKLNDEMAYFYLKPSQERYNKLQSDLDNNAVALKQKAIEPTCTPLL